MLAVAVGINNACGRKYPMYWISPNSRAKVESVVEVSNGSVSMDRTFVVEDVESGRRLDIV